MIYALIYRKCSSRLIDDMVNDITSQRPLRGGGHEEEHGQQEGFLQDGFQIRLHAKAHWTMGAVAAPAGQRHGIGSDGKRGGQEGSRKGRGYRPTVQGEAARGTSLGARLRSWAEGHDSGTEGMRNREIDKKFEEQHLRIQKGYRKRQKLR